jgi:hypothetical protein
MSIHSIISHCSSKRAIQSHSSVSSSFFISSNLSTLLVTSGNVVIISSNTVLSLDSRNKSWERYQIFKSLRISISPLSAKVGSNKIFKNVDFPAQFFQTRAILS